VKVAVVAPAGTTSKGGTERAEAIVLITFTFVPPVGAGPERVTVHDVELDAARLVVPQASDVTAIAPVMVNGTNLLDVPSFAVRIGE
jgi:hypothetical protein